jgi:phage replication O-like protein O
MQIKEVKGWGQLPREMARALARAKINGSESRVLWALVYKTIAFNKASDRIPWSQISELTGIDEWNLSRSINGLLKKGLIMKKVDGYGFLIDYDKRGTPSKRMVEKDSPSVSKDSPSVSKDLPSNRMVSRDLSKRAFQEKGLSAFQRRKKQEEFKKGFEMMKEAIGKVPDEKKKISESNKKKNRKRK